MLGGETGWWRSSYNTPAHTHTHTPGPVPLLLAVLVQVLSAAAAAVVAGTGRAWIQERAKQLSSFLHLP